MLNYYQVGLNGCTIVQPYEVAIPATQLPVSLAEVKEHLRLDTLDLSQDTYLTFLIQTATNYAEKFTRRTMINTTYLTYRNCFSNCIELRKSKVTSIVSFEYLQDGSFVAVDSDSYYLPSENGFAHIALEDGFVYPSDNDINIQAMKIQFVAGYGATSASVPDELRLAILNHIASMYENRGDCSPSSSGSARCLFLPCLSKAIYNQFKIKDLTDGSMCC